MDILNTSWKAERFFIHIFKLKNTLFGRIWPSPSWWAEAQETQQVPSRECLAQAYTQRVIHKHSMICYPTWQQLHVVALMPHPLQTSLIPPPANRAKYFRKVTVLAQKKKHQKTNPWQSGVRQTQVQVMSNRAELAEARESTMQSHGITRAVTHAHLDWILVSIFGRYGRTAT